MELIVELSGDIYTIETAHDEGHVFWSHKAQIKRETAKLTGGLLIY